MTLWLVLALMTAAAIFAVLWPLSRRGGGDMQAGSELAVYRDQLDEIERDRAASRIGATEAEAARVEVSRRLIAAADAAELRGNVPIGSPLWRRRAVAIAALVLLPIVTAVVYLQHGSPQLPGEPLAARSGAPQDHRSIASLVSQVEAHIEKNPNDGRGWEVLAPVYLRMGRFDDAVKARRNALQLNGETAQRQADLGEAVVAAANGIVTTEGKTAFERALGLDPQDLKSRFYIGLAAEQDGNRAKAGEIWRGMLENAPADAPWVAMVREALARIGDNTPIAAAPGPSAGDLAAASQMTEAERGNMVRSMVARLAERLKQDGSDVEGWLRLLRAYMVLGERGKAQAAAAEARQALANDPDKLRRIDELVKGLGLSG